MFNKKVIVIVLGIVGLLTIVGVIFGPKTFSDIQVKERQRKQASEEFLRELKSIKTEISPEISERSNQFESQINGANESSLAACDSLVKLWDKAMYPQVAAYFYAKKAELVNSSAEWTKAGKRFLAVSAFTGDGNRGWAIENAQYSFEKALDLDSENKEARIKLAASIVEAGQEPMKGIGMLREVLNEDPKNTEALMELGRFAMVSGQMDKAIGHFSEVIKIDSNIEEAKFYLSDAYAAFGEKDSANKYLDLYLQKVPNDIIAQQAKEYMKSTYGIE